MRWMARRARRMSRRARVLTLLAALVAAVAYGRALLVPANAEATHRTASPTPSTSPAISSSGQPFGGLAAVGALFTASGGQLGSHFCTASVVHSTHGDLAVTAAHCLDNGQGQQVVFVPGYDNGKKPYGVWAVTAVYADQAWQSSQDPDDDVAFLRLSDLNGVPIEHVTGAERIGTVSAKRTLVRVIGYPGQTDQPIACLNWAQPYSATQLEFDCHGYTDGTSGAPFLAASSASGQGTILAVIGGYEQGGDTENVSYASAFGASVMALYRQAEAAA
jgi:V8-like Glu-specific endopeptidase